MFSEHFNLLDFSAIQRKYEVDKLQTCCYYVSKPEVCHMKSFEVHSVFCWIKC